jgi:hypothetical protein
MSQRVRGVSDRGLNIPIREPGISLEEIRDGGALAELSQNQLDRDLRSPHHGLAHHHLRIDLDSIRNRHRLLRFDPLRIQGYKTERAFATSKNPGPGFSPPQRSFIAALL